MSTEFINDQWRLPNAWNGTESNVNKQSNYSMDYDATNQSVIVSSNNVFNFGTGDFTLSAWIKVDSFGSSYYPYILDFRSSATANENAVAFYLDPNGILQVWISNSLKIGSSGTALVANTWYNVILKRESGTLSTHINGGSADQTASYAGDMNTTPPLTIGARAGNIQAINGQIDAVAIFNYALSQSQITTLYGSSSTGIGNPMSLSPKPVAYYPLGDQDAFNGADYLVPNSSLKDYVFNFDTSKIATTNSMGLTQEITVSAWVKIPNGSSGGNAPNIQALVSEDSTGGTTRNFKLSWRASTLKDFLFEVFSTDGTRQYLYSNAGDVNDGNWHHVVGTWDGTTNTNAFKIYVDKVVTSTTATKTGINIQSNVPLTIGANAITGSWPFEGNISNVQIWDKNLSSTEVETLYNNGSPIGTLANIPQNSNLQGWWKLDASATFDSSTTTWTIPDDSTNSNDGTSSGMTQANLVASDLSFKTSISPFALDFDAASSDYIDCGTDSSLDITGNITFSGWINRDDNINSGVIISKWASGSDTAYILRINSSGGAASNSQIQMLIRNTSGVLVTATENVGEVCINKWVSIVGTYDGSNIRIYYNGFELGSGTSQTGNIQTSTAPLRIGSRGTEYIDSQMSNVSIWNTALTSAQVSEIYNEGVPSNLNNHSAYSNLVSWWQLGSNSSFNTNWTVLDEKGSNNGTSVNMGEDAIVDGVGSYANGLSSGMGGDEVIGSAPFSDANSLSINMDVLDRVEDTPS